MDAACGPDGWRAAMVTAEDGRVLAAWPFRYRRTLGIGRITLPPLTPWTSLHLDYPDKEGVHPRHSFLREVLPRLAQALPPHALLHQAFFPAPQDLLGLQWSGFRETVAYSHLIRDTSDSSRLWAGLRHSARKHVAAAQRLCTVDRDMSPQEFLVFHRQAWQSRGQRSLLNEGPFLSLAQAALERGQATLYRARDAEGRTHAAIVVLTDSRMANVWQTASDPALRTSGALPLLYWTALSDQVGTGRWFDFEGGMMPNTETAYSAFGAAREEIRILTRTTHRFWDALSVLGGMSYR